MLFWVVNFKANYEIVMASMPDIYSFSLFRSFFFFFFLNYDHDIKIKKLKKKPIIKSEIISQASE